MVRNRFETELEELHLDLIRMGSMAEQAIENAMRALASLDAVAAEIIMEDDDKVDGMARHIESKAIKLIMRQHPVARDLRSVSAALKMITDLERICDQAADIAEIIRTLKDYGPSSPPLYIADMGKAAVQMVRLAVDAFVGNDLDIAEQVIAMDDTQDRLFGQTKGELMKAVAEDSERIDMVIDYLMIAKYLERISDHAENIADWTIFAATGMHKNEKII